MADAPRRIPKLSWAGLVAGPLGWALTQQTGSSLSFDRCTAGAAATPWLALVGLLIAVGGLVLSWRIWRNGNGQDAAVARFLALVAVMAAGLFALAILLQGLAAFYYQGCER